MKRLAFLFLLCPFALQAAPNITVSGNSVTILGSAQTISLTCTLIDPNQTGMLKSGSNIITVFVTSTVTPGSVATCGPIYGNDVILDAFGTANTTYYKVQVFRVTSGIVASTPSLQAFYAFQGSGTVDLSTATPVAATFLTGPGGNVSIPGTLGVTGATTLSGSLTANGTNTFANLNKVIFVDQQTGATADVKFANACAALPATGGTLDARGFGPGNQSTAAAISCGSVTQPVTFLCDPATNFQPGSASQVVFQIAASNRWQSCHADTSNQATYSGNAIFINNAGSIIKNQVKDMSVTLSAGATTGNGFAFVSTGANAIVASDYDITCTNVGTGGRCVVISSGGTSFFSGNHMTVNVNNNVGTGPKYCVELLVTGGSGSIAGNIFDMPDCELASFGTSFVHLNTAVAGNNLTANQFRMSGYDIIGANPAILVDAGNVCGNTFTGMLANATDTAISDATTCGQGNYYTDLIFGNIIKTGSGTFNFRGSDGTNGKYALGETGNYVTMSVFGRQLFAAGRTDLNTYLNAATNIQFQVNTSAVQKLALVDTTGGFVTPSYVQWNESATPGTGAAQDTCYGDSTLHHGKCNFNAGNGNAYFPMGLTGNTAGTHSDSGFYQTAGAAGCTTAASIGGICVTAITITWPVAFQDANYKVTCTPIGPATNLPSSPYVVTPTAASVTINYFAITAAAASWPTVNCTAIHN